MYNFLFNIFLSLNATALETVLVLYGLLCDHMTAYYLLHNQTG